MGRTSIEWTRTFNEDGTVTPGHSINPFKARNLETGAIGHWCVKISGGCAHCYASTMQKPYLTQLEYRAENRPKVELFFDEKAIEQVLRRKKPTRYFWCDMTDMFLDEYPDEWIDRCFAAMALTPQHTHMVLTKRAERMREYFGPDRHTAVIDAMRARGVDAAAIRWPLPNVWLGVSVEDQTTADARIPHLLQAPAAVRFVSCEPALGPVDFENIQFRAGGSYNALVDHDGFGMLGAEHRALDWIICGGESGPGARPCDVAWLRAVIQQCEAAGTACFVKQLGGYAVLDQRYDRSISGWSRKLRDRKGGDPDEWPADLRVRQFPEVRR